MNKFKVTYESVRPSPLGTVDLMPSVVTVKANSLDEAVAVVLYYFPTAKIVYTESVFELERSVK